MEYIDIDTWDRRDYFNGYLGTDFPYINIGANLDVTRLLRFCKKHEVSSYLTMVFSAHQVASQIVNFRYRIKDGRPILNDRIYPIFTYLLKGTDIFINVMPEHADELMDFVRKAKEQIARQGTDTGARNIRDRYDIISYTVMPWIQYMHFVRTIRKLGVDSNPKISWGKYFRQGKKTMVPFSVQVHHGLMDGLHVGRYFEALQKYIDDLT